REELDSTIFTIRHVDNTFRIDCDAVGKVKLTGPAARLAPRRQEPAVGREAMDAGVAVAVGDVQLSARRQGEVGWVVKGRSRPANAAKVHAGGTCVGCLSAGAQGKERLTVRRELADGVIHVIGTPDAIIRADRDTVRPDELALTPRGEKGTI